MKSCTDSHCLDTSSFIWKQKKSLILLDRCTIFLSNPCWHNHIKSTSLILTFTIFIRPAHISPLHFAAASAVVVTVQSKSVKDYSLQFSVQITALFAELKHFDDHNCAKCGKHFPNRTPFWSFSNGHVISPTTNHWTGKLTELHSCIAVLWFTDAWLDFSISKSRLICAKLCQIIESKSSKEEKPQCHFQNCSCLSQCSKSHFPTPKKVKSQFLFYPFRTLL